ncbi:MAG: hypothetical protein JSU02_00270 [Bacteroidetes bacterium]|nr:hypothetical protein [Bacteroidota bacterium]
MKRKRIFLVLGLVVVATGVLVYRMTQAKPALAHGRTADLAIGAPELFAAFQGDETAAGKRYNDKLVAVKGAVRDVSTLSDGMVQVLLETGDPLGAVVCALEPGETTVPAKGDTARIQGFCAGYNLDVLLQRCSVLEPK